jgi:hypothetical protein
MRGGLPDAVIGGPNPPAARLGTQPSLVPLSTKERSALIRILGASKEEGVRLAPRQRAALDAYADILSAPPLSQEDVVRAARAMIKVWADVGQAKLARWRSVAVEARLLDLEDEASSAVTPRPLAAFSPIADLYLEEKVSIV